MRSRIVIVVWLLSTSGISLAQCLPEGVVPLHYTLSFSPDIPLECLAAGSRTDNGWKFIGRLAEVELTVP